MGIPFYYRHIIQRQQKTLLCNVGGCDGLFLDFNSIIHSCAGSVISKFTGDNIEEAIFTEICTHTKYIASVCPPQKLLFVAIDGVAPRSKIQQQRKRRYISAYRNDIVNKFKDNNNIRYTQWDSNCITPGTSFMKRLYDFLKEHLVLSCNVIISGANEPGEGEHKIFEYIRKEKSDGVNVIYGLDADLIMLSMCCETDSRIYLMREGSNFSSKETEFKFLDIANLQVCISKYICDKESKAFMYDYVFICFLLGNDFLPNLPCLKIKLGAIDMIMEIYKEVYEAIGANCIHENNTINYEFVCMFFEKLCAKENDLLKQVTKQFYDSPNVNKTFTSKLEKFTHELDNYPSINKFPLVINPEEDTSWRNSYYHHLFGCHQHEIVNAICANYIQGLVWTCNYYFNNQFDKLWYYRYNYAPCSSDIYKYLKSLSAEKLSNLHDKLKRDSSNIIINEHMQLLMVLPPLSKDLLDKSLQKIMTDVTYGCSHLYPKKFCLTSYLKHYLWECSPVIPNVDLAKLKSAYEKVKST